MRGIKVSYKVLSQLLKDGRERKQLRLEEAAMMIGMTSASYLCRCESGVENFPASSLKRALGIYGIPISDAASAICEDFQGATLDFLRAK